MMNEIDGRWRRLKSDIALGDLLQGTVFNVEPFGVFVYIGYKIQQGYIFSGIIDVATKSSTSIVRLPSNIEAWPKKNDVVTCKVIAFRDWSYEVDLGLYDATVEREFIWHQL